MADQPSPPRNRGFHAMPRAEFGYAVVLVAYSIFAFLPAWREIQVGGLALYGWLLVGLMVFSPILAIAVFRMGRSSNTKL